GERRRVEGDRRPEPTARASSGLTDAGKRGDRNVDLRRPYPTPPFPGIRRRARVAATRSSLHTLISWSAFPLILGGGLWATVVLAPSLGTSGATAVGINACVLVLLVCEALCPYETAWRRSHGDVGTDVAHALVSGIGVGQLVRAATQTASA